MSGVPAPEIDSHHALAAVKLILLGAVCTWRSQLRLKTLSAARALGSTAIKATSARSAKSDLTIRIAIPLVVCFISTTNRFPCIARPPDSTQTDHLSQIHHQIRKYR